MLLAMPLPPRRPPPPHPAYEPPATVRPRFGSRPSLDEETTPVRGGEFDRELEAFRRRILSEVDAKIEGVQQGIADHVKVAVRAELAPYVGQLQKLDEVLRAIAEMRNDTARYRDQREERERAESDAKAQLDRTLEIASKLAGIQEKRETVAETRLEGSRRYRIALWGTVAAIVAALAGLGGAAVGSHYRAPEPEPSHHEPKEVR